MREEIFAAKAAELELQLRTWGKEYLSADETLVVTLRAVPSIATIKVMDFFSLERLKKFSDTEVGALKARNALWNDLGRLFDDRYDSISLSEYLERITQKRLLRANNFGKKSLAIIIKALEEEGLQIRRGGVGE